MTATNSVLGKGTGVTQESTRDLIGLLQQEVGAAQKLAEELRRARADNERFLKAIQERDALIREYVETIQSLRLQAGEVKTAS